MCIQNPPVLHAKEFTFTSSDIQNRLSSLCFCHNWETVTLSLIRMEELPFWFSTEANILEWPYPDFLKIMEGLFSGQSGASFERKKIIGYQYKEFSKRHHLLKGSGLSDWLNPVLPMTGGVQWVCCRYPGICLKKNKCRRDPNQRIFRIPISTELSGFKKIADGYKFHVCSQWSILFSGFFMHFFTLNSWFFVKITYNML